MQNVNIIKRGVGVKQKACLEIKVLLKMRLGQQLTKIIAKQSANFLAKQGHYINTASKEELLSCLTVKPWDRFGNVLK